MAFAHLNNHIKNHELSSNNTLYVIGVISNTERFHSRYRIAREWIEHMEKTSYVSLKIVEIAFGDRQFEITNALNPNHLQLKTDQVLWHKENMINLGVRSLLPNNWKYMAWIDMDVFFRDPNWALETIQQLQHYPVVQPWSECIDLGFYGNAMQLFRSFGKQHRRGIPKQYKANQPYEFAHCGFAWACTRFFWENIGSLMDFPILGSADHHMAWAMIGQVDRSLHGSISKEYKQKCFEWQDAACRVTHGDAIGFVNGIIEHKFHGPKAKRKYVQRWQLFVNNQYNPNKDLIKDPQGLLRLIGKPKFLQDIRNYMSSRDEDEIGE